MPEITIKNAIIRKAKITTESGFLDCWLDLDYGGIGQGFGGYTLYLPKTYSHHEIKSHAGHFLYRVMEIAGVSKWSDLVGKTIRVKGDFNNIIEIGHIINDDWFNFKKDVQE